MMKLCRELSNEYQRAACATSLPVYYIRMAETLSTSASDINI
jgi:hypothetical protein